MGAMELYLKDLYPGIGAQETSTEVIPEPDEQDALGEDKTTAEATKEGWAGTKKIVLAVIIILCLVVFLGAA